MPVTWLDGKSFDFPAIDKALTDPDGLLAAGGDLSVNRLLAAYRNGIFPWYEEGYPILWWSPDPRMVLLPSQIHVARSLRKLIRKNSYEVTMDRDFENVIRNCAGSRPYCSGTWITKAMQAAYNDLHRLHYAHSVEVWHGDRLVGGLYGVALGQIFFAESMFSHENNTSKLALVFLAKQLQAWNFKLIDCQIISNHLRTLGAATMGRTEFYQRVQNLVGKPDKPDRWQLEINQQRVGYEF
ncbi:MAG: leucyl/phenylalanyl-tRNA--protein transferase [Pseudohongiellaceae bacterium]